MTVTKFLWKHGTWVLSLFIISMILLSTIMELLTAASWGLVSIGLVLGVLLGVLWAWRLVCLAKDAKKLYNTLEGDQ